MGKSKKANFIKYFLIILASLFIYISPIFISLYKLGGQYIQNVPFKSSKVELKVLIKSATEQLLFARGFKGNQFNDDAFKNKPGSFPPSRIRTEYSNQPSVKHFLEVFYAILYFPLLVIAGGGIFIWPFISIGLAIHIYKKNKAQPFWAIFKTVCFTLMAIFIIVVLYMGPEKFIEYVSLKTPLLPETSPIRQLNRTSFETNFVIVNGTDRILEIYADRQKVTVIAPKESKRFQVIRAFSELIALDTENKTVFEAINFSFGKLLNKGLFIYNIAGKDKIKIQRPHIYTRLADL